MARLIDTSLWIDFTRRRSPAALKRFVAEYVNDPRACLAEPIAFEVLRHADRSETAAISAQFETLPLLSTPLAVWQEGALLGRTCRSQGLTMGSLDILIATVAIHHGAELITFDVDFERLAAISPLKAVLLRRP